MKLYYTPGACSLAPHIALCEAGLAHELVQVDLKAKKLADGGDFLAVNPKGQVPAVVMDDGNLFTEGPVISQIIADKAPGSKLAPAAGTLERYRLLEWLNLLSSDIHKNFGPLFSPVLNDDAKAFFKGRLISKLEFIDGKLAGKDYLMGDFTIADGYLFTMLRWADAHKIDLSALTNLMAYKARVAARPGVQQALKSEGLQ